MLETLEAPMCFISYAHMDRGAVARLTTYLQQQGINVWIDREGIMPGMPDWEAILRAALRSSQALILIVSPHTPSSRYIKDELALAHYYQLPVYPLWIAGDVWIESIPLGWGSTHYIDARGDHFEQSLAQLARTLKASLSQAREVRLPVRNRVLPPQPSDERYIQQRESVVQEVYTLLTSREVTAVTLTGIAGVGKSTIGALVFQYSEDLRLIARGPFLDEPIWLRIEATMTTSMLVEKLFDALRKPLPDIKTSSPQDLVLMLFEVLRTLELPRLIIFDQFENFLDSRTGQPLPNRPGVEELIAVLGSHQCASRILLTSRSVLQVAGASAQIHLKMYFVEGVSDVEGIELLHKRGVILQQATDDELRSVIHAVSGHTLSLTLIASILQQNRSISVSALFNSSLYTHLWIGNIAEIMLDHIYKRLDSIQRKLLRAFSVYREPVPLEATHIFFFPRVSDKQYLAALDALLVQHLLQAVGGEHYQMHTIITTYVRHQIRKRGEKNAGSVHEKAAQYYLHRATTVCPPFGRRRQTSDVQPFLESIWHRCQAGQWQEAYQLLEREHLFTDLRSWGNNVALLELYRLLLPVDRWSSDNVQSGHVYERVATLYFVIGQAEQALELFEQALMVYKQEENYAKQASILTRLGETRDNLGDKRLARIYFERAIQAYEKADNDGGKGEALTQLAWICQYDGEIQQAQEYLERALQLLQQGSVNYRSVGIAFSKLGTIYLEQKKYQEARESFERALRLFDQARSRGMGAWTLGSLASLHEELGEHEQARVFLEEALRIFREVKDRRGEGWILNRLGKIYTNRDQLELASNSLHEALHIFQEIHERIGQGAVHYHLGYLYQHQERPIQAQKSYKQAWDIQEEIRDFKGAGLTLQQVGLLFFDRKDYEGALASFLLSHKYFDHLQNLDTEKTDQLMRKIKQEIGVPMFELLKTRMELQTLEVVRRKIREAK